ncbi:MAG: transposase, partial [Bacillota bacterium]
MSVSSRKEYLEKMHERYCKTGSQSAKTAMIDEVVNVLGYHRKHAIRVLNGMLPGRRPSVKRRRQVKYLESLPAIQLVWEALDYPCAERPHPVLAKTAQILASHG